MDKTKIIKSISERGNGEIYLGIVGAVRTGKSTFIKRFIENIVVPNIEDEYERKRCLDEIPQSSAGKTIMTTEPKFVPSNGANIKIDNFTTNMKLIDCVGFVVRGANGYVDEMGNPRMVKTPWTPEEIPFEEAAEIGTEKVIRDHATIGIVITTDGSFGEIARNDYVEAEDRVIKELKEIDKPFIVLLNSLHPTNTETEELARKISDKYNCKVMPISSEKLNEKDIVEILRSALMEFKVEDIKFQIPSWVHILPNSNKIKMEYLNSMRNASINVEKLKDVDSMLSSFTNLEYIDKAYISDLNTSTGIVTVNLSSKEEVYKSILKETIGDKPSKAKILKVFMDASSNNEELKNIKSALKEAKRTGYGIIYPELKDMKLEPPTLVKQGARYGVKLKAIASSMHLVKVDVESTFEPIIGSETESKELIDYLLKDSKDNPEKIWQSEIFGRSLDTIVKEGIRAKLSMMPENTRFKLSNTITKIVNKGANNLITIVI